MKEVHKQLLKLFKITTVQFKIANFYVINYSVIKIRLVGYSFKLRPPLMCPL